MVYRPNREETVFDDPPNGKAIVKLLKNKRLRVKFLDDNGGEFAGKTYKVSDWPENINPRLLPGTTWKIRLDNDGKSIYSVSPLQGRFTVRVSKFVSKEDEDPTPRYMDKWKYPDYVFYVLLEIVEGPKAAIGMEILMTVPYRFGADEDGNVQYTKYNERSNTLKTEQFLILSGGWDKGELKFKDNVLPAFQKRILKADKRFGVDLKNGFVDYMSALHEESEIDDDDPFWDEDEKPKKKKKKKSKKIKESDDDFDWEEKDDIPF